MLDFLNHLTFKLPQASTIAAKTDLLYDFIYWFSVASFIPTIAAMIYFGWKYHASKREGHQIPYIHGHPVFEWTVSAILSVFFVAIYVWGLVGYYEIESPPAGAYEINVQGQQWAWQFQYANGKSLTNKVYVPSGVPVKFIMTSKDVLHDLYIPDFRLKHDVVPGSYSMIWFQAIAPGEHDIFCTQYCGTAHSNMIAKVVVLPPEEFKAWLNGKINEPKPVSLSDLGSHLFSQRNCVACHSVNGTANKYGPTLKGLFGQKVMLADGKEVIADENYIRESIVNPTAKIVKGYGPIMPTFKGLLDDEELGEIVSYLKSLKE
jgi:cytochrome c oxidase subunit 2